MATTNTDYSIIPQNSYAAFDAMSLRNLIIERLNEQGTFTDQNYIGSNLASIIDIISFSFNTLMFYLNRTSTESMFTEAQLYENINRIVKLLDYKPVGYQTSTLAFQAFANIGPNALTQGFYLIPRYSYLMIGGIPFSFNEDITLAANSSTSGNTIELTDLSNNKLLYQGIFRETPIYTATGSDNEMITLNVPTSLVDHFNIHVYVNEKATGRWYQYKEVNNLYTETTYQRSFEKRLNSDQLYEITFGDNITGRKLDSGDQVVVYYLQSFGEQGVIGPNILSNTEVQKIIFDTTLFTSVFQDTRQDSSSILMTNVSFGQLSFINVAGSTLPKAMETVDSIRKNAPTNFKSQYRLVTQSDYETFIKINFDNFISDVKILNNWEYASKYLKYFKDLGINATTFQQIALNQTLYADSCNFNNVYICCLPKSSQGSSLKYLLPAQKEIISTQLETLKMSTADTVFMDPIFKAIKIGFEKDGMPVSALDDIGAFRLELIRNTSTNRSNQSLIADAVAVFENYFDPTVLKLGTPINYTGLVNNLLDISGVQKLRTFLVFGEETYSIDNLALFCWNPTYPDLDKKTVTTNLLLESFEYPFYPGIETIANQITVS